VVAACEGLMAARTTASERALQMEKTACE